MGFSGNNDREVAYQHIQNLKEGVLLVRLNKQDAVLTKMKFHGLDKEHRKKEDELRVKNKEAYEALSRIYDFSEIHFFYSNSSKMIREGNYSGVFLGPKLIVDTAIKMTENVPVYILDVGDIYFPEMSGHQEGVIVLNNQFEPLTDPYPYFVRRRTGLAILERTDSDIAKILNNKLKSFYNQSLEYVP